jgi:hypothetical protein
VTVLAAHSRIALRENVTDGLGSVCCIIVISLNADALLLRDQCPSGSMHFMDVWYSRRALRDAGSDYQHALPACSRSEKISYIVGVYKRHYNKECINSLDGLKFAANWGAAIKV